jgi:hypothetical protein
MIDHGLLVLDSVYKVKMPLVDIRMCSVQILQLTSDNKRFEKI